MRDNDNQARSVKGPATANALTNEDEDGTEDENELAAHWQRVKSRLRVELGEDVYSSWFAGVTPEAMSGKTVHLSVPTRFLKSWIGSHYLERMLALWQEQDARVVRLELSVRGPAFGRAGAKGAWGRASEAPAAGSTAEQTASPRPGYGAPGTIATFPPAGDGRERALGSPLDPRHSFDSFIVGASNQLAHAAASQVATSDSAEGTGFNILFMHGAVGLGKTHLLQATAWESRRRRQPDRILYLTAERFMYRFVAALKAQDALGFKDHLRGIDLLLIDDMQFLQGKSIQQEFCHTLNALMESGRQVVVAADRPPAELDSLDDRMRSRLSAGLVVDIRPLGRSLRLAILRAKREAAARRFPTLQISDSVLEYVADQVIGNGRELEGAFTRIVAHNQLTNSEITVEMAERAIRDLVRTAEPRRVRIEHIQKVVAKHFNVSRQDIVSSRRNRSIVRPRQISMYLAKTLTDRSFPEIGRRFGGRDHTTVLHAVRKIEGLIKEDRLLAEEVELLKRMVEE